MNAHPARITAVLLWISIGFSSEAISAVCDVDNDGDVDRLDLRLIAGTYNTPSDGPDDPRDADGDGTITKHDLPVCIRQCSSTGCVILDPALSAPGNNAGRPKAAGTGPSRNVINESSKSVLDRATASGAEWIVKRGDTLYSIARSVFPQDTGKQERLRKDIVRLNSSVFVDGVDNMDVGAVLKLPDYVGPEYTAARGDQPKPATSPQANNITSSIVTQSVDAGPIVEPAPAKVSESTSAPDTNPETTLATRSENEQVGTRRKSTPASNEAIANALVSLGYSHGGDKLVDLDGSRDLYGGSGAHFRLGFEHMLRHGGGYRVALGLQYNLVSDGGDSKTYRDAYLQLAYQYRASPLVYGVGVIVHTGPTLEEASTREYDAAAGAVVYLENVGNSALTGWGLSYTTLEIEEQGVEGSIDASRAELYYNWRF